MYKLTFIPFIVILILVNIQNVFGYDDQIAHPKITEIAVEKSVLKTYLPQNLGPLFLKGYDSLINEQSVKTLIREGSKAEDADPCLRSNHMHNPIYVPESSTEEVWDKSYMSDEPWWAKLCFPFWGRKYSNVTWATGYLDRSPEGQKAVFSTVDDIQPKDWDKTRKYYYQALTAASYNDRMTSFEKTFITMGHVLHLLQDMAVPAHTRNDFSAHLIGNGPAWSRHQPYEHYVADHIGDISLAQPEFPQFTEIRTTDFWDKNIYTGSNPSSGPDRGLAETTNANYLSEFTIPTNMPTWLHVFAYPDLLDPVEEVYQECEEEVIPGKKATYISRSAKGPCPSPDNIDAIDHFAVKGLLRGYPDENSTAYVWIDDKVNRTYAKELLPRAVGYSAALLDYFFRGQINLRPTGDANQYVIINDSNEEMNGDFSVHYDSSDGQRYQLTSLTGSVPAHGQSAVLQFDHPSDAQEPGKYMLAFRGIMGNEADAVAGRKVVVDLCSKGDPTTISISGPDEPVNGSQYSATGGSRPYTWTIDKGSITQEGIVAVSNQCGVATITATDVCGNKGEKVTRMQNGAWILINEKGATLTATYPDGFVANMCSGCNTGFPYDWCSVISGKDLVSYYSFLFADGPVCASSLGSPPCSTNEYDGCHLFTIWIGMYEWRCQ